MTLDAPATRYTFSMHTTTNLARTLLLLALASAAPSCGTIDNDRGTVGGETLPLFQPEEQRAAARLEPATGPSLDASGRGTWPVQTIVVSGDGTQHHPRWTTNQPAYSRSPRALGQHPTVGSAFELGSAPGPVVKEGFAAPFHAATDVVLGIPRLFLFPPGAVLTSPTMPYQRGLPAQAMPAHLEQAVDPAMTPRTQSTATGIDRASL